jgi:uncharacterized repeat protein (TIGR01451 family)
MSEEKRIKKVLRVDKQDESSLSAFVERPLPSDKEVASFERAIHHEARNQEIDSNLSEIYRNKKGGLNDVKKVRKLHRQNFLVRWFRKLLILAILGLVVYFAYLYFFSAFNDVSALELNITAPEKVLAGEEFSYLLKYHNPTKFAFKQVRLEIQYPSNFIFSGASLAPTSGNYGWSLADLAPGETASLSITGKLINKSDAVNVVAARLSYVPNNVSSQFKKEASVSTLMGGPGFQVDLESSNTAFLGQENDLNLIFSAVTNNYLDDFNITFSLPEEANAWVATTTTETASSSASKNISVTKIGGASWLVSGLNQEVGRQTVPLKFKINTPSANPEITVRLEKKLSDGQAYIFWEKTIKPELVKSDLNLTLFLNGEKNDNAVNFGQTLNYTLSYNNQGSNTFSEVVMMAVLTGDFLDLNSLRSEKGGQIRNQNTLVWTKNELPELAEIKPGSSGEINFTVNLKSFSDHDLGKNLNIVSYGQYSVNNKPVEGQNNKSNTITSKINSDLSLLEQIRYFNTDNIPVGSGPLPPQVNEKTSFKVYWTVKNNLHELTETRVVFSLPSYVKWDEKSTTNVGSLAYDPTSNQVIWEIGRLPVSVYRADAEFGISLIPTEADRGKILILSSGSTVSALDSETKDTITKKVEAKTTKLEDDDIAGLNNSGLIQ